MIEAWRGIAPLVRGMAATAVLVTAGSVYAWTSLQARISQAERARQARQQEYAALVAAARDPAQTPGGDLAAELVAADMEVQALRAVWLGRAQPAQSESGDVYFDLAAYVAECRAQAEQAGVTCKPGEAFGFAASSRVGSVPGDASVMRWQRQQLQILVGSMLAAHPAAVLAVQRQRPAALSAGAPEDFFSAEEAPGLALPPTVTAEAFRLEFTGSTATLRTFLNAVAAGADTALVRAVTMSRLEENATSGATGQARVMDVIEQQLVKFTVTVACLRSSGPASGATPPLPELRRFVWPEPVGKPDGWNYELFTPPVIYRDATTRSFRLMKVPGAAKTDFGLRLLAVKPELFRVQLGGCVGGADDCRAALVNPYGAETWLVRPGYRFAGLGLELRKVGVRNVPVQHADAWPVYETAAMAVLWDERSASEVVLDSRQPRLTGVMLAELQSRSGRREPVWCREGDLLSEAAAVYRITRIRQDPAQVDLIRCDANGHAAETRTLRPEPVKNNTLSSPPAGGLATHTPDSSAL